MSVRSQRPSCAQLVLSLSLASVQLSSIPLNFSSSWAQREPSSQLELSFNSAELTAERPFDCRIRALLMSDRLQCPSVRIVCPFVVSVHAQRRCVCKVCPFAVSVRSLCPSVRFVRPFAVSDCSQRPFDRNVRPLAASVRSARPFAVSAGAHVEPWAQLELSFSSA